MARWLVHWFVVVFLVAGTLAWNRAVPQTEDPPPKKSEDNKVRPRTENPFVATARKLNQKMNFQGVDDPKTTLADFLETFGKVCDVHFEVNDKAFRTDGQGLADVLKTEIAQSSIWPMKQASMEIVLRKVLARIPCGSDAVFVIRKGYIEITTGAARQAEFWPNGSENAKPNPNPLDENASTPKLLPLAVMEFDSVPLDEALRDLATATSYNVVLDARAGDKGKVPVTASLINVPLDTAVRMLADMAELKPVLLNNAIYVTTEKRADRFQPGTPFPAQPGIGVGAQAGALGALGIGGGVGLAGGFGFAGGVGFGGGFGMSGPFGQAACAHIDDLPLAEALNEVTDGRKVQVLLDKKGIGPRGNTRVSAELDRVPLETCIRLLTDMAGLSTVFVDNVAYVTTREKAHSFLTDLAASKSFPQNIPATSPTQPAAPPAQLAAPPKKPAGQ